MDVYLWYDNERGRSKVLAEAFAAGVKSVGDYAETRNSDEYRVPIGDVAVLYGYGEKHRKIFADYLAHGRDVVFLDLGYWQRDSGGSIVGMHKVCLNDQHPIYLWGLDVPSDRWDRLGIETRPMRYSGDYVLLAGLSLKAAGVYGLGFQEWERNMVARLRKVTDLPIMYRAKPNSEHCADVGLGDLYSDPFKQPLNDALSGAVVTVSRHSNVSLDGLIAGVPFVLEYGIGKPLACAVEDIPKIPEVCDDYRRTLLNKAAYGEWNVGEMRAGLPWRFLRDRELFGKRRAS